MTAPGAVSSRFEVAELVGAGGMGMVYRARDRATGRQVALKILPPDEDPVRFEREASALARLRHPGIVGFVDHGLTDEGRPYLAMSWLEGETLASRLKRKSLSMGEVKAVGICVAEALVAAHGAGVVHRDLKPSNLFLQDGDPARAVLIDFGIAALASSSTRLTTTGTVLGTAAYMAPEQARGDGLVDGRCDLFSLGSVLFRALTGRPPFDGGDVRVILAKLMFDEPPALPSHVPETLAALVRALLQKDPSDRPASARQVLDELSRVVVTSPTEDATLISGTLADRRAALSAAEQQLSSVVLIELAPVHPERGESPPRLPERAELAAIRARAATFGATLEPLAEGALIAVLRGSEDATDLCARAARCALALKRRVPAGSVLAVATGRAEVRGKVLVGEVVERAAQVLAIRSESEGIRLDDVSAGLLDASFVQREGPSFSLLVDYRPEPGTLRTMLGRETPCVGRTREIAALLGAFDECVDERSPRVALVTGAAGVGKSRLRHEVAQALARHPRGPKLWLSRGDPVGGDSAFRLLLELARAAGDAESVSALMRQDEPHSAWRDPQVRAQRIHEAWEALLRAECSQAPLVVMLDDLSWCDAASLACLDDALRNLEGSPLLVLAFGRVDVHERFPGLWQKRGLLELGLGPLSTRAQIQLATLLLGPDADPAVAPHIAALAAGNAFYLEELVRAVVSGRGDTLPDTVLAMAQSRFAALPGSDRRLLRAASIFGGPFWPEGLRCLLGADARPAEIERELERLCHDEVLQRDRDSAMPSSTQWSFPQALLREAAYHALTEDDRLLGHRLAAEWLESVGVEDPAVLAHHWAHAGEHERARGAFVAAAWTAFAAGDPRVVRRFAERALTEGARDELMGEACFLLGAAARWKGDLEHSLELHERSLELLPRAGDLWRAAALRVAATAAALGRRARFLELAEVLAGGPVSPDDPPSIAIAALLGGICLQSGDVAIADRCFEHLDSVDVGAVATRDPATAARILEARARRAGARGDLENQLANAERAVLEFEQSAQTVRASQLRIVAANAAMSLGDWQLAREHLEHAIPPARRHALENVEALCRANLGLVLARGGDPDAGLAQLGTAIDLFARQRDRRGEGGARAYRAQIQLELGQDREARADAESADELLRVAPPLRPLALAVRASALLRLGRVDAASECAEEAWTIAEAHHAAEAEGWALAALALVDAYQVTGDRDAARELVRHAASRIADRAKRITDPARRRRFLEAIPEHARLGELAAAD